MTDIIEISQGEVLKYIYIY